MFPLPRPIEQREMFARPREIVDPFSFGPHVRLRFPSNDELRQAFLIIDKGPQAASAQRIVPRALFVSDRERPVLAPTVPYTGRPSFGDLLPNGKVQVTNAMGMV